MSKHGCLGKKVEIPKEIHRIDADRVDRRALEVVKTLRDHGYKAYIVGGAVRDLLLGLEPKDFDVATNATPEEVKGLFRRSFIIGRRFRIVHVIYGRGRNNDVIEVSTFRAYVDASEIELVQGDERTSKALLENKTLAVDESGRVLRDNVWGPQEEDAARRDFTINAMYYDPLKETVVDYHQGFEDACQRVLRMIGYPVIRYREDPVRILRVVRFAAKLAVLDFKIDEKTQAPIQACLPLLKNIPPSRMFDEMVKFLQTGHAQASITALYQERLLGVFPLLDEIIKDVGRDKPEYKLASLMFEDTDERIAQGKTVVPSFMLACLLWPEVKHAWEENLALGELTVPALHSAIGNIFDQRVGDVSGRGRLGADMREIWLMQPRFERRTGTAPFNLVNQARFRAAFDFMRL
ncbi:MAG: polynucleotide adenylyltransferase PcnB, partial [Saezia sp.]